MPPVAEDQAGRWEPFGVTEADFAATPEQDGMRVVNVRLGSGQQPERAGWWLRGAAIALGVLAVAAAAVSWAAQFRMVWLVKHATWVAALEAGIPDVGAAVFAALGVALALHGKRAVRPRALNAACIGISLAMNALAAGHGWRDLAIWVMPAAVYALASDTLIGVVRAWVLARARNLGETLTDDGPTLLAMAGGAALWLLRLSLAPKSTLAGFRDWVVTDCPVAPGLRPGHVAQLEAARQDAARRLALAAAERDEAVEQARAEAGLVAAAEADRDAAVGQARGDADARVAAAETERDEAAGRAAAEARQAREDAVRAQAAEAAIRDELERIRSDADQRVAQALADAARDREETREQAQQQADRLRAELDQVRDEAERLAAAFRDASGARITALEDAHGELLNVSGRLAEALEAVQQLQLRGQRPGKPRGSRSSGPTKRDQMIELAGQRQDLATVPLAEVSKLAGTVAAQIGYSPGTARRELVRHVRQLQAAAAPAWTDSEGDAGQ
jgi:flagellar biosynthesis GTPase FlhF